MNLAAQCPSLPPNDTGHVTPECGSSPPSTLSAPNEHSRVSQQVQEQFSLTLSLDSNTEDEYCIDNEFVQPQPSSQKLQPGHHFQQQQLGQQAPLPSPTQEEHSAENIQPPQVLPALDVASTKVSCSSVARVGLRMHVGSSSPALSSSATFASSSSSLPFSGTLLSLSTFCSSMVDSSNFAGSSFLCNHHVSPANPPQDLHPPEPQAQALAPPVPLFTPGKIVLGIYFVALHSVSAPSSGFVSHASVFTAESVVVPATLSDTASLQPSLPQASSATSSPVAPKFHRQLKVTAETLLPDDSMSSSRFLY